MTDTTECLALDEHGKPRTGTGGGCRGVVTLTARGKIERNVECYLEGWRTR